jgi:hypothetical protein
MTSSATVHIGALHIHDCADLYRINDYAKPEAAAKEVSQKLAVASPMNRRSSGSYRRGLFGYEKSPDLGKKTQFKPGQSGNPRGRPRKIRLLKPASAVRARYKPAKNRKKSDLLVILKPRPRKYLEGILSGKTKKSAALAAGYSESTARNAAAVIERPLVRLALQEIVREVIPPEKIVQRLAEGLDAMDTVFARYKGKITDQLAVIAWDTRLHYIELAAKMAGYYVEGQDLAGDDLSKSIESRSNEELDYYLEHGRWPETQAGAGALVGANSKAASVA